MPARAPCFLLLLSYLQPEQEAQQSAESQHDELACAAPANPSATTATNRIALIVFIEILLCD